MRTAGAVTSGSRTPTSTVRPRPRSLVVERSSERSPPVTDGRTGSPLARESTPSTTSWRVSEHGSDTHVPGTIAATARDEIQQTRLLDLAEPPARWTRGRVTLLGDAAHPMMPDLAQGASQTFVDSAGARRMPRGWHGGRGGPAGLRGATSSCRRRRRRAVSPRHVHPISRWFGRRRGGPDRPALRAGCRRCRGQPGVGREARRDRSTIRGAGVTIRVGTNATGRTSHGREQCAAGPSARRQVERTSWSAASTWWISVVRSTRACPSGTPTSARSSSRTTAAKTPLGCSVPHRSWRATCSSASTRARMPTPSTSTTRTVHRWTRRRSRTTTVTPAASTCRALAIRIS